MDISSVGIAKLPKVKLEFRDTSEFIRGKFLTIKITSNILNFEVIQYGPGIPEKGIHAFATTDAYTAALIRDNIESQNNRSAQYIYVIENVEDSFLEVQPYSFNSIKSFAAALEFQVDESLADRIPDFENKYVWKGYGNAAVFSLNYKKKKSQPAEICFISNRSLLRAKIIGKTVLVYKEESLKERDYPVDLSLAPEIKFVKIADASSDDFLKHMESVSSGASYLNRWNAYYELSKEALKRDADEFGEMYYSKCVINNGMDGVEFRFTLNDSMDRSCIGRELCVQGVPKNISVGTVKSVKGNEVVTTTDSSNFLAEVPSMGELILDVYGSELVNKRRHRAKDRIIGVRTPIKTLVSTIELGSVGIQNWETHPAVTAKLKKNFPKSRLLNDSQRKAIELAINTPDFAVIQGPPGTGKTTVIKAICERFRELFEAEEHEKKKLYPEYILHSPKILISSFQNEAVDNAISSPLPGDIPPNRKMARHAKESTRAQNQNAIEKWAEGVRSVISEQTKGSNAARLNEKRCEMGDKYLQYKNANDPASALNIAASLLNEYLSFTEIHYEEALVAKAKAVIAAARISEASQQADCSEIDPFVQRLEAQRLDKVSFADDGLNNAKRFRSFVKLRIDEMDFPEDIMDCLDSICGGNFSDKEFARYVEIVSELKKRHCTKPEKFDVRNSKDIDKCLLSMSACFNEQYMKLFPNQEDKVALILEEFLDRLDQERESLVRMYAMTTAATCQNSLNPFGLEETYDLVIVDEAARANPLDLFIPMSMGKKVILVGDHKQLPHMLEPDVVKRLKEDPRFKDFSVLEQSLFERLFEMLSQGNNPKTVMLDEQFRMPAELCAFVSKCFYDGKLKTSPAADPKDHEAHPKINNGKAIAFINVSNAAGPELPARSMSRKVEAEIICEDVKKILEAEPDAKVGVIAFYSAQVALIDQCLEKCINNEQRARVEIGSIDAFQGKEYDYVLLSCVRSFSTDSSKHHNLEFLDKPNRLCVAFSRSIRQLAVYGDAQTLKPISCIDELFRICSEQDGGYYREV